MQANDAADRIHEVAQTQMNAILDAEGFRQRAAVMIAVLAMLLAIANLAASNASQTVSTSNVKAADTWAFYQAKNIRQTSYALAADALEMELQRSTDALSPEVQESMTARLDRYRKTVARYDSEPDPQAPEDPLKGEGKKELLSQAQNYERLRDQAEAQGNNFSFASALIQIAIVLASVAILTLRRALLTLALGLSGTGVLLMLNGFLSIVKLPF